MTNKRPTLCLSANFVLRTLYPFLAAPGVSSPILSNFVVALFHVTAYGDPRQAHRTAGCDSDVRH